jgi:hypothetical protein
MEIVRFKMSLPKSIVLTRGKNLEDKIEGYRVEGPKTNIYDIIIEEYNPNFNDNSIAYLRISNIEDYINKRILEGYTIMEMK